MVQSRRWTVGFGLVAAVALVLGSASPAHASGETIRELFSNLCLDANVASGHLFDGDNAQGWGCNTWHNQDWPAFYGPLPAFQLKSGFDQAFCLDADIARGSLYDGAKVQLWHCNGWENQKWYTTASGGGFAYHSYKDGNFCLDFDVNGGARNGTKVQVWHCNGSPQQAWVGP